MIESITLTTTRCLLRPAKIEDAEWMLELFNDKEVVSYIEGIKWFNSNVESVKSFIMSMDSNLQKSKGILWCVITNNCPAGIIMANDLEENPYLTFALFEEFREKNIGTEIFNVVNNYIAEKFGEPKIESINPIVKKITRRRCEYLFIGHRYFSSLNELKDVLSKINPKNLTDKSIIEEILSVYRDGSLISWLYYIAQKGDERALEIASSLRNLSAESGDRSLLLSISKIICPEGSAIISNDISSLIKINPTAIISYSLDETELKDETELNIFQSIHIEPSVTNCELKISFEIRRSSLDIIDVEIDGFHHHMHLDTKQKQVALIFPINITGKDEEKFNIMMDGYIIHTLNFQKYPNKDWDNEACTLEGVRNLYNQDYKKALLCFNCYKSSADLFWLGIMEYIGVSCEPRPKLSMEYFERASLLGNATWGLYADVFRAFMVLKGEGCKQDIDFASALITKHSNSEECIRLLREAISGNLKSDVYEDLFYGYNISERNHTPKVFVKSAQCAISPRYLLSTTKPFYIEVDAATSANIKQLLAEDETLHAYIGVTTARNGDWQYVIENDWITNASYNTFEYDPISRCYGLKIENLNSRQKILPNEKVLHLNIILRNADGTKQFPQNGSYYAIDCLTNNSHIALCNISTFLMKFPEVVAIFKSLKIDIVKID